MSEDSPSPPPEPTKEAATPRQNLWIWLSRCGRSFENATLGVILLCIMLLPLAETVLRSLPCTSPEW